MQVDVAFEVDGSGHEHSRRYNNPTTASLTTSFDRGSDRVGCRLFTSRNRSKFANVEILVSKNRSLDAGEDFVLFLPCGCFWNLPLNPQDRQRQGSGLQNLTSG